MKFFKDKVVVTLIGLGIIILTLSIVMFLKMSGMQKELNLLESIAINSSGSSGAMIDEDTFVGIANYGDDVSILFNNDDGTYYTLKYTKNGDESLDATYVLASIVYNGAENILDIETDYVSYIDLILEETKSYTTADLAKLYNDN